ncbi:MAG TPA: cytochrome P450 [Pirellulales bacterium]|jgi:cytochrome P450 PksS
MKAELTPNIASAEFKADPFPFYARLRAEEPVSRVRLPEGQEAWLITRYDDVAMALKDERFAKDQLRVLSKEQLAKQRWVPKMFQPLARNMLDVDPPDHTRLRALVQQAFAPRRVEAMRPRMEALATELLDAAIARRRFDLVADYALPIPTTIISDMLGVPEGERHKFHGWSKKVLAVTSSAPSAWKMMTTIPVLWNFMRYIRRLIKLRRDDPRDDLVSALVAAHAAEQKLSDDELLSMIFLLIIAGHETTVNLIASGTLALLQHPDQLEKLRANPDLIKPAIEELLRYTSPVETGTERFASEPVEVAGVTIPQGALVMAVIASANRDERQFSNADTLDITREPNRHLAFGLGIHFCLGASLARLEGQIAINTLLTRAKNLRLAVPPEAIRWRQGLVLRGMESLPVEVGG